MKFFVLAGGYGKRARPLSLEKPKPAFPLNGTPLLTLLLDLFRRQGVAEGFINLHYLAEQVTPLLGEQARIKVFYEERLSGSRVLQQALPFLDDFLLVANGDVFLDIPIRRLWAMASQPQVDGVLLVRRQTAGYASLQIAGGTFKGTGRASPGGWMYTGVALFRPQVVETFGAPNFFRSLEKGRFRIRVLAYRGIWLDVGTPAGYYRANFLYRKHLGLKEGNALSPRVRLDARARLERTVVWENARLGGRVRLRRCIVGGSVRLVEGAYQNRLILQRGIFPF